MKKIKLIKNKLFSNKNIIDVTNDNIKNDFQKKNWIKQISIVKDL